MPISDLRFQILMRFLRSNICYFECCILNVELEENDLTKEFKIQHLKFKITPEWLTIC